MRASTPTPLPSFQALAEKSQHASKTSSITPPSRHPAVQLPSASTSRPRALFSHDSETRADMYIGANTATVPYPFSQQSASAIGVLPPSSVYRVGHVSPRPTALLTGEGERRGP